MRGVSIIGTALALWLGGAAAASAGIVVTVDKSAQSLTVTVDGVTRHQWPVSTGRWGYNTPTGTYRPQRLERQWFSRKYDWSPMPYSIFFNGGYAIHGSNEISRLGRPASHGCIRLHPSNAAVLFDLVKRNTASTRIEIIGNRPEMVARSKPARRETVRRVEYTPPRAPVAYRERPAARQRVIYSNERPAPRRASTREPTFEVIFEEPPRYYRGRRVSHWED